MGKGDKSRYCKVLTQRQQNETEATVLRGSLRCVGSSFIADSHGWVLTHAVPVFNHLLFSQVEKLGTLKDFLLAKARRSSLAFRNNAATQLYQFSSLGLAPPKMAEFGLATWFRGSETVRGFNCSLGLCALSSSEGSLKSVEPPRGGPSL